MIPALNDHELESILEKSASSGATSPNIVLLRLRWDFKFLFTGWLENWFPQRAEKVFNRVAETMGGDLYNSSGGERQKGVGEYVHLLQERLRIAASRRLGLAHNGKDLSTHPYRRRPEQGSLL